MKKLPLRVIMKRYKIIHRTYYNYTDTVRLGSHHFLLRPREDHDLRIESFVLNITPDAKIYWHRDVRRSVFPSLVRSD